MQIIKDKRIIEDPWRLITAEALDQALPAGDVLLPFDYWQGRQAALRDHPGRVAVYLNPEDEVEPLRPFLADFSLLALYFPQFKDGRPYSQARALRQRLGYSGELRAVGDVLRDQLFYMQRCGFDAFQVRADKDIADALAGLDDFSIRYQGAADDDLPLYRACRRPHA